MKYIKIILPILLMIPLMSTAQCRSFTKKKCLPVLNGYVQNDNYNSAMLIPGDEADLLLTFYGGKEYRLLICSQPVLGDVEFEVYDDEDKLIYSNESTADEGNNYFDFKVKTTMQLLVKIKVPADDGMPAVTPSQGCVTVMIGSKEE